ncbi:Chaperone protein dnaJ-related [Heracleum sosnowskyi]|uniref:Chaperone protein dnaJ-related n=1 Tax=Heracleum sosnowskyi TaxID=360622 RepID=A0AAD8NCX6_9APIA|nr:Chaperone protein dnaJ-related [Heracleum sosnowskyi]
MVVSTVISQVATGLSVLAGAALLKSLVDQNSMAGPGDFPRCPSCNGSGRVSCFCSRWSDGDRGCRSCAGSGRMACSSCGGSGTGRPIPAQLIIRNPTTPRYK